MEEKSSHELETIMGSEKMQRPWKNQEGWVFWDTILTLGVLTLFGVLFMAVLSLAQRNPLE